jgi:hypothetical protein
MSIYNDLRVKNSKCQLGKNVEWKVKTIPWSAQDVRHPGTPASHTSKQSPLRSAGVNYFRFIFHPLLEESFAIPYCHMTNIRNFQTTHSDKPILSSIILSSVPYQLILSMKYVQGRYNKH